MLPDTLYDDNLALGLMLGSHWRQLNSPFNGTFDAAFAGKYLKILGRPAGEIQ